MKLHQTQSQIAKDKHRFRVINCGRRWGKTTLAVEEMKGKAVYKPRKICYIAPTYQQARDIAWQITLKELQPVIKKINESRLELTVRTVADEESQIFLRGWESIETLRGQQFDFIVIDEIAQMRNFWENWQEVVRPTLTDTRGEGMFISTPKGFNHFYDLYNLESGDDDFKSFHFTTFDNPHIPKDEIEKAQEELTEDRFAQEYLADFRKTEGLVYKEFNRDTHVFEDPGFEDEDHVVTNTMGGIDFGYANPCAIIQIEVDRDRNYWVYEKLYKTKKTDADIAEYATALKCNEYYPDPENPGGIVELSKRGCNVREVIKGKGSVQNGINIVRELFKQGRLYIHNEAINLIHELETYSYPDKKPYKNEDENPIKENDHACDALRYALMMKEGQEKKGTVHIYRPKVKARETNRATGWANKYK